MLMRPPRRPVTLHRLRWMLALVAAALLAAGCASSTEPSDGEVVASGVDEATPPNQAGSEDDSGEAVTVTTVGAAVDDEPGDEEAGDDEPGDEEADPSSSNVADLAIFPADAGLPEVVTIEDMWVDEAEAPYSCMVFGFDPNDEVVAQQGPLSLCDQASVAIGNTFRIVYRVVEEQAAQQGKVFVVGDLIDLGSDWQVVANADWHVTIGRMETWTGVNRTGDLLYYGCDASPSPDNMVAGLNEQAGLCIELGGGTVDCRDGVCVMAWLNSDVVYTLSSPISEDDGAPSTLRVQREGQGDLLLESIGLEVVAASSAVAVETIDVSVGGSATVSGAVIRGERANYAVPVPSAGIRLRISITSLEDNAVVDLIDPSGVTIETEATSLDITVPASGDYQLVVGGTRGNATFDLTVALD